MRIILLVYANDVDRFRDYELLISRLKRVFNITYQKYCIMLPGWMLILRTISDAHREESLRGMRLDFWSVGKTDTIRACDQFFETVTKLTNRDFNGNQIRIIEPIESFLKIELLREALKQEQE